VTQAFQAFTPATAGDPVAAPEERPAAEWAPAEWAEQDWAPEDWAQPLDWEPMQPAGQAPETPTHQQGASWLDGWDDPDGGEEQGSEAGPGAPVEIAAAVIAPVEIAPVEVAPEPAAVIAPVDAAADEAAAVAADLPWVTGPTLDAGYLTAFAASSAPLSLVDLRGGTPRLLHVNDAFTRLTGWTGAEAVGGDPLPVRSHLADPATLAEFDAEVAAGTPGRLQLQCQRRDGTPYWCELVRTTVLDDDGTVAGLVLEHRDLRSELEQRARSWTDTHVDPVTGFAARSLADAEVERLVASGDPFGLLVCRVEGVDRVNLAEGRETGDALLAAAAQRLTAAVGEHGRIARYVGAEFVVLVPDSADRDAGADTRSLTHTLADRIEQDFRAMPVDAAGRTVRAAVWAGTALYPADAATAADLLDVATRQREEVRQLSGSMVGRLRWRLRWLRWSRSA